MSIIKVCWKCLRSLAYVTTGTITTVGLATLHYNEWDVSTFGAVRFGRTALAATSIGMDYKFTLRGWQLLEEEEANAKWSRVHERSARKLLNLCIKNGGAFIKIGQHIGAMDYIVPPEYCSVLKVLHSNCPRSSLDDVRQVFKEDLGKDLDIVFSEFEEEPRGTASLAQVHRAVLRDTGEVVAVKVQHKRVKSHSMVDMTTMDLLVRVMAKVFPEFSFLWLADEMKRNLPLELDFVHEGKNAEKVKRMLTRLPWLRVPKIEWSLSSPRVLTMEFLEGGEVTDKDYVAKNKLNPRVISDRISTLYNEMIFVEGFVHCDPHPGNILVRDEDKSGNPEIILLDHGLYCNVSDQVRLNFGNLWIGIMEADEEKIKKSSAALGAGEYFQVISTVLAQKSWNELMSGIIKVERRLSHAERKQVLKNQAKMFILDIPVMLGKVNREVLLLLKTEDLLRGMEQTLGTFSDRQGVLKTCRYSVRSVFDNEIEKGGSRLVQFKLSLTKKWLLTKLLLYQLCMKLVATFKGPEYL